MKTGQADLINAAESFTEAVAPGIFEVMTTWTQRAVNRLYKSILLPPAPDKSH
jgi:hypothetical protein